jgi:4-oxalocrotonate tautomerase
MPTISIEMFEGRTRAQKEELVARVTDAVVDSLGVERAKVRIKLHDLQPSHSAEGGVLGGES